MIPSAVLAWLPPGTPRLTVLRLTAAHRLTRIDSRSGALLLREHLSSQDAPGCDWQRELAVHASAAAAGLAPRVVAVTAEWLLTDWVDAPPWSAQAFTDPAAISRLGQWLRRLHALPLVISAPFDALAIAHGQVRGLRSQGAESGTATAALLAELETVVRALQQHDTPAVINHGDLDAANLLGEGPCGIDFEYAQLTDPLYDIACVLTYYPAARPHAQLLLQAAGLGDRQAAERLPLQLRQFAVLDRLWRMVAASAA